MIINKHMKTAIQDIQEKFGITFPVINEDEVCGELILRDIHRNFHGIPYGGCLFSLADNTAGMAFLTTGGFGVTVSGSLDFLRGAVPQAEKLLCRASVKKSGKNLCFVDAEIKDDTGRLLSRGHFIFMNHEIEKQA